MGIDYLIIVLSLTTFLGFLSLMFIYLPFMQAWQFICRHYRKIQAEFFSTPSNKIMRNEPSLRNTGLNALKLTPTSKRKETLPKRTVSTPKPQHTLTVLYVIANSGSTYNGYTLWHALTDQNLMYGDSKIFHAYGQESEHPILFSVAGAIEPGYFEVDNIASIRLPGLCLFMKNDATPHPLDTFEYMLEIAKKLAHQLGGTVCDDQRQPLSETTIEYYQSTLSTFSHQE